MDVRERAKLDLENGDHWLARTRLKSLLTTNGYDPELLKEIGQISYDMYDAFDAGRMWLLSTAEGKQVDDAIEKFIKHSGPKICRCVNQLPNSIRLTTIDQYPATVQDRIKSLKLEQFIPSTYKKKQYDEGKMSWKEKVVIGAFIIAVFFACGCTLVGCYQIEKWIFG